MRSPKTIPMLRSAGLILSPMTDDEIRQIMEEKYPSELSDAYREMLEGCLSHPDHRLWYAPWKLCLKSDRDECIGDVGFKGPPVRGGVEIGYGMHPDFEGNGYMTEAVKAMVAWAFQQEDVYRIYAETAPDNAASQRVLDKAGFSACGEGEEGPRFRIDRPPSSLLSLWMLLGMSLGMSVGFSLHQMSVGLAVGLSLGVAIGSYRDAQEKKHRQRITGETDPHDPDSRP